MTIAPDDASEIVEALYRGYNERDADAALANIAPGVDWQADDTGRRIVGRDALRAFWQGAWQSGDPRIEPMQIAVAADGTVVVRVDHLVRDLAGKVLVNQQAEHVLTFDGLFVTRMDIVALPEESGDDEDDDEE